MGKQRILAFSSLKFSSLFRFSWGKNCIAPGCNGCKMRYINFCSQPCSPLQLQFWTIPMRTTVETHKFFAEICSPHFKLNCLLPIQEQTKSQCSYLDAYQSWVRRMDAPTNLGKWKKWRAYDHSKPKLKGRKTQINVKLGQHQFRTKF